MIHYIFTYYHLLPFIASFITILAFGSFITIYYIYYKWCFAFITILSFIPFITGANCRCISLHPQAVGQLQLCNLRVCNAQALQQLQNTHLQQCQWESEWARSARNLIDWSARLHACCTGFNIDWRDQAN